MPLADLPTPVFGRRRATRIERGRAINPMLRKHTLHIESTCSLSIRIGASERRIDRRLGSHWRWNSKAYKVPPCHAAGGNPGHQDAQLQMPIFRRRVSGSSSGVVSPPKARKAFVHARICETGIRKPRGGAGVMRESIDSSALAPCRGSPMETMGLLFRTHASPSGKDKDGFRSADVHVARVLG